MAAEREYRTPDEFIQSMSPAPQVDRVAEGDLNGDGLSDRVILVGQKQPKLYILLQTRDGGFYLAHTSQSGSLDNFEEADASVSKGSVYVSVKKENIGLSGFYTERYQFKLYRGVWRMIGLTYISGGLDNPAADAPPDAGPTAHQVQTDINLLTGDVIVTHTYIDYANHAAPAHHKKAPPGPLCLLAEFAFAYPHCLEGWKFEDGREVILPLR